MQHACVCVYTTHGRPEFDYLDNSIEIYVYRVRVTRAEKN